MNPKVSVIMPVYNSGAYLQEAIESILFQTFTDFEFIIINDGSTDNSVEIIKSFSDNRIIFINNPQNQGIIKTRNQGLQLAKGEFIACMDSDDISLPERLEKQLNYFNQYPETSVLATRLCLISPSGNDQGFWKEDVETNTIQDIAYTLPIINCIGQPTALIRSKVIQNIGYNKLFVNNEDWGLWLFILAEKGIIAKLNQVLLKYRLHDASTTAKANAKSVRWKIIRFKLKYVCYKIFSFDFKHTDYNVLLSLLKDLFKSPEILRLYKIVRHVKRTNFIKLFVQCKTAFFALKSQKPYDVIFFFPFYHTGGAESVHASILKSVNHKRLLVLITGDSEGKAFLNDFKSDAKVVEINELLKWSITKKWILKKLSDLIAGSDPKLFGCNSKFLYETLEQLPQQIKAIDLIHAFVHEHEDGPEKWSLPVVEKLEKRVVINKKTKEDFRDLYQKHNLPGTLLNRILEINNFVESEERSLKNNENLKILYVGRAGEEKRVYLIGRIATIVKHKYKKVDFHFVGEGIENTIADADRDSCIFHGEITDKNQINEMYKMADILLITSTREGFPMVIMEGMMHGVIPFATNVGGIAEHVNDLNGVLINETDEDKIVIEIADKILYFAENRNVLQLKSVNAYNHAVKFFNKKTFFEQYKMLLSN